MNIANSITIFVIIIFVAIVGYFFGRHSREIITVEKKGSIIYRDKIIEKIITNIPNGCEQLAKERDKYYDEYVMWMNAEPVVYGITKDEIKFSMRSNKYSISYYFNAHEGIRISPIVGCSILWKSNISTMFAGGVSVDYAGIGGQIIIGNGFIFAGGYYRF